jgi:hypothetical protein
MALVSLLPFSYPTRHTTIGAACLTLPITTSLLINIPVIIKAATADFPGGRTIAFVSILHRGINKRSKIIFAFFIIAAINFFLLHATKLT